MAISTSVSTAVAQTVSFLTRSLVQSYSATTISRLQLILEANLTAHYTPSWNSRVPLSGSSKRCVTLSRECLPPSVIYSACLAAGVQWFDWMNLLGAQEFDLLVDPGCVYIRVGHEIVTIWRAPSIDALEIAAPIPSIRVTSHKTVAQRLLENEDDDDVFHLIADEMKEPVWATPITDKFILPRATSPFSTLSSISSHSRSSSAHSRSSSRSSMNSSVYSDSDSSSTSSSSSRSRRERTKVFVDTSKNEVTPYDGGKTTVLTGGVMLGAASTKPRHVKSPSGNWRAARA